jgi:hypothetical protein
MIYDVYLYSNFSFLLLSSPDIIDVNIYKEKAMNSRVLEITYKDYFFDKKFESTENNDLYIIIQEWDDNEFFVQQLDMPDSSLLSKENSKLKFEFEQMMTNSIASMAPALFVSRNSYLKEKISFERDSKINNLLIID